MNRHIPFERLHNFRDLGGYVTEDGSAVRWGRLFRSDSLGKLKGQDWERFLTLGVRTVIDLRYPWEIAAKGRVPEHPELAYHNLSIEHRPYDQPELSPESSAKSTSAHACGKERSGSPHSVRTARPPGHGSCGGTIPPPGAPSLRPPATYTG